MVLRLVSKTEAPVRRRGGVRFPAPETVEIGPMLADALTARWKAFAGQLARTRRRPSEREIHDMRVSTRRMIALLDILRDVLPQTDIPKVRRRMKHLLDALSALRDVQVQILHVRSLRRRFPDLDLYRTVLLVREKLMLKQAKTELVEVRVQSIKRTLLEAQEELKDVLGRPAQAGALRPMVMGMMARKFARAAALRPAASTGNIAAIHRLRVAFKQFRYTVEVLQPVLPAVDQRLLRAMSAYQGRMGAVQDINVLLSGIQSHMTHHRRSDQTQYLRLRDHLRERRDELVGKFISAAAKLDGFWNAVRVSAH